MRKPRTQLNKLSATAFAGILLFSAPALTLAAAGCANLKGCEKKFCEIENQLRIAQEKGNSSKVEGTKKALKQARVHCTDSGLKADLADDIAEAKDDLAEHEADLKDAEEDGKTDKVRQYQDKIAEDKRMINRLEQELAQ